MKRFFALVAAVFVVAALAGPIVSVQAAADSTLDPAMVALWERTDRPVANQQVDRSWLWGPQANHILTEPYNYAPLQDSQRLVAYFDKSRMEINDPSGDSSNVWYVTNGRLVYEMMTGKIQIGQDPDQFTVALPANIPVAGDPYSYNTPTYQTLGRLMGGASDQTGQLVTATLDYTGTVGQNLAPVASVHQASYISYPGPGDTTIGHNVPDVFWAFLTQQISPLVTPANWVFVTGYPLTEPYWTKATVNNNETDVMVQCFERRCLTYTPTNNDPYKVEMGNVGQHYYAWRYEYYQTQCSATPVRGFGELWTNNDAVRSKIGCPETYEGGEHGIPTAVEQFQNGMMIWIDVQDIYNPIHSVLVLYKDGTFARFEDTWTEGQPIDDPNISPPAGLYQPVRGFGKVWREAPNVRDRLGWATAPEQGSDGAYQRFNYGTMILSNAQNKIWVFYGDLYWQGSGTWEVYPNTYTGS